MVSHGRRRRVIGENRQDGGWSGRQCSQFSKDAVERSAGAAGDGEEEPLGLAVEEVRETTLSAGSIGLGSGGQEGVLLLVVHGAR